MEPVQSPIRVILAGVGQRGKHWALLLHENPDTETVAYVDVVDEHLTWAQEQFDAPKDALFTDFEAALDNKEADAVILVTPPMVRYEQCFMTVDRGLPMIAEKPLTMEFETTLEATRYALEHDVPLVSGFNFRFLEVTQATKQLLESGELGEPSFARVFLYWHRTGTRPGGNRYPLVMEHPMVLEQSVHALDLIRYVYQSEVESVYAITHNPPWSPYVGDATATALLTMENGMLVNYLGTWMGQSRVHEYDWRTDCTKGAIFQKKMFSDLYYAKAGSDELVEVPLEVEERSFVDDTGKLLQSFVDSLLAGTEPGPSAKDNLKTMALTCAVILSAETGERIDMEDFYRWHGVAPKELLED
jgi:predicted dehydrogenase